MLPPEETQPATRWKLTDRHPLSNLVAMVQNSGTAPVLAVVLNWCAEEESTACIKSLMQSDMPLDILLIDNASPDGSGRRLHESFSELPYLQTPSNIGYAGGNLLGTDWAIARGYPYVLIANDDSEVQPTCVRQLMEALDANPGAAASAPTVLHHGTNIIWFGGGRFIQFKAMGLHERFGERFDASAAIPGSTESATFLNGCVWLFRSQSLQQAGGLRPDFFGYIEDTELSVRLIRAGWELLYVPAAVASHKVAFPFPPDSTYAIRQRDRNRRRLVSLHYQARQKPAFWAWYYPTRLVHLLRYIGRRDWARTRAILTGTFGSLRVTH